MGLIEGQADRDRIAHLRIAHQVANPEVGNLEGIQANLIEINT